jgi:hypothetical protein
MVWSSLISVVWISSLFGVSCLVPHAVSIKAAIVKNTV